MKGSYQRSDGTDRGRKDVCERIRVLIVEDLPTDAELSQHEIAKALGACEFLRVETREDYLSALAAFRPALIVSDFSLPSFDGLSALKLAVERCPDVPFIILTGSMNEDTAVECMKAGAWDYVIKEHVKRLGPAVQNALVQQRMRMEHRRAEEKVRSSLRRFELLTAAAADLLVMTDPQEFVEELCRRVMEQLDCHVFFNFLADEKAGRLHLNACTGIPEEEAQRIEWLDYGVAVCGCVARDGCRIVAENIQTTPDPRTELVKSYGIRAYACHPLQVVEGKVIGTLSFGSRTRETFSDDDLSLMRAAADQVAGAMVRAQTLVALRRSEEQLRFVADHAPVLIAHCDHERRYRFVNQPYAEMFGLQPADMCGKHVRDILGEEAYAVASPRIAAALAGQRTDYSLDLPATEGGPRAVHVSYAPECDASGRVVGFIAAVLDITERKQAEAQLEILSRFPTENPYPVLRAMPDGTLLYANPSARPLLEQWGCEPGQSLPAEWVKLVADAMATGKRHEVEVDCSGRSFTLVLCPLPTAGYLNAYGHDITERKRAGRELQESRQLVEAVVENVPLMIFLKEAQDLRFVVFNKAGEELLGYDRKDLLGKNALDLFPPEQAAHFVAKDREALAEGALLDIPEEPILTAKKGTRLLHTRKVCIKGADGVTKYLLGISEDITERKRMESERQKLEEQLRASQKMEAIGSLAGGVAHDFNNLLSVILSYTGFAMEGVRDGDPLKNDLLEVKKAGERAAALTRQLLAFSRKQILQPVALDLNQIAAGVEKMLQRILGEDVDLVQTLAPDLGLTLADPGQIEQVLMNLVVNARDAMPVGGKLTIETSNVEIDEEYAARHVAVKPGSYVQLAVSDTGSGMDEHTRARIFEPFFTTKEKGKGTGLGLSTVYGIVKQSGGNIWVYSELGQGTTFKIYLPRELSAATATVIKSSTVSMRSTGTETILVVEDEEALRKVALRTLEAAGYKVLTAADGAEALMKSAQHAGDIQILLTDVVMPGMSGRVLAQELAKTRPTVKVVYMSGYTDNAIVHHGVLDAGTHFLAKPFISADLTQKVREVLDEGTARVAGAREPAAKDSAEVKEEQPLNKAALRGIPEELLSKLRRAVTAARYDEIALLIETVRTTEPEVAAGLRRMADLFDYDGLRDLLGQAKEE
jgi:PAS domain S-box-containing protein